MSNRQFSYLLAGLTVVLVAGLVLYLNGFLADRDKDADVQDRLIADEDGVGKPEQVDEESSRPGFVKVGGVWRENSEIGEPIVPNTNIEEGSLRSPGQSPLVKADANPQVESIKQALAAKRNAERLTVFKRPKEFDRVAFEEDPAAFLNTIEPARAMMPAQPGPDVKPIRKNSPGMVRLIQGESTTFEVQVEPNAFVTFHTTDLGAFSNGIKTINVKANQEGVAEATYTATAGTIGNVQVAAASPYNSEMVRFVVNVRLPEPTARIDQ